MENFLGFKGFTGLLKLRSIFDQVKTNVEKVMVIMSHCKFNVKSNDIFFYSNSNSLFIENIFF